MNRVSVSPVRVPLHLSDSREGLVGLGFFCVVAESFRKQMTWGWAGRDNQVYKFLMQSLDPK
jgi:hypothetical protein